MQTSKSAQLVICLAEALRNVEYLREGHTHLGSLGRRCAQCGLQPHFLAPVLRSASTPEASEMGMAFTKVLDIAEASGVDAPSAACSLISWRRSGAPLLSSAPSACSARPKAAGRRTGARK